MKKWYWVLAGMTAMLAAAGASLSLSRQGSELLRTSMGRLLVGLSIFGFALCALLKPKAKSSEMVAVGEDAASGNAESVCTFSDVAANDEARQSLEQLKNYIVEPERYRRFGARMPKGVLLYGPPGTGKTLLARALAGEAGVPFFALSGSDFVEKYVGVGAKRVRELFKRARKAGKCVIFIDEIDAMCKCRSDHSSDERDQTLNALLSEMSGFHSGEAVIVVAATNRIEMLDPALLRPGRFDRQIEVGLPNKNERLSILKLHSRNKPLDSDVRLDSIAAQTAYFSGASLENLMNEAAILAANDGSTAICMRHLQSALVRVVVGAEKESTATEAERKIIALHEAGHAVAARVLMPSLRIARVSILPASRGAAGYNLTISPERVMPNKRELENQISILLAGRAAELLIGGEDAVTSGASNDIERATELAAAMVCELGMAGEPAVSLKVLAKTCPGGSSSGEKVRSMLEDLFARAQQVLADNIGVLDRLAQALLDRETLDEAQVDEILGGMSSENDASTNKDQI